MAKIELVHFILPSGTSAKDMADVLADIQQNQRLATGYGTHGHGVYAYYPDRIPVQYRGKPGVVFEIEEEMVKPVGAKGREFAFVRVPFNHPWLKIEFRRILNPP